MTTTAYEEIETEANIGYTCMLLRQTARRLTRSGCYQQALGAWRSCYFTSKEVFGFYSQSTAASAEWIGRTLVSLNRCEAAAGWFQTSYFINRQNMGVEHESTVKLARLTAECLTDAGIHKQAHKFWQASLAGCSRLYGDYNWSTVGSLNGLVNNLTRRRLYHMAIERGTRALAFFESQGSGEGRPGDWLNIARLVGECLSAEGMHAQAAKVWSQHLAMLTAFETATPGKCLFSMESRAIALQKCGRYQEALADLEVCIGLSAELHGYDSECSASLRRRRELVLKLQAAA